MLKEIDDYNWEEAFKYAQAAHTSPVVGDDTVSTRDIKREDVVAIFGIKEGVQDEENWELFGFSRDGRFFVLSAGCDYTGWG